MDDVADGLAHLLAVGVEYPARDQGVRKRKTVELQVASHDRGEKPGADDLVGLQAKVHRKDALEEFAAPVSRDLRRERTRGPGVHHVGIADEAEGFAALALLEAEGRLT